jgi:hypothetical protein
VIGRLIGGVIGRQLVGHERSNGLNQGIRRQWIENQPLAQAGGMMDNLGNFGDPGERPKRASHRQRRVDCR